MQHGTGHQDDAKLRQPLELIVKLLHCAPHRAAGVMGVATFPSRSTGERNRADDRVIARAP